MATTTPTNPADPSPAERADGIRLMFDRIARRYSRVNTLISLGLDAHWRQSAVRAARVRPGDRLLDVCCGPGELADAFAAANPPPREITAVDFSAQMIAAAQHRQPGRRVPLHLIRADATRLPLPDACVEIVSCAFGLRNIVDANAALAEFRRVLRPGGRLVILEFAMPQWAPLRWAYRLYFRWVLPLVGGLAGRSRPAYRYLPDSVERYFSPGQLADKIRLARFDDVRQQPLSAGIAVVTTACRPECAP